MDGLNLTIKSNFQKFFFADLKLSDDVAAATFMSTATSSPELFTTLIGTFITESDIGVGHVIGNAYYDMFFVAAVGGLAAKGVKYENEEKKSSKSYLW